MKIIHLKAAIQKAFSAIGKKNGSAPPQIEDNRFGLAYELFVASELRSAANKRYDAAKAEAVSAGVLDETRCVEGAEISVYESDLFDVTMKQASASTTLDKTQLKNYLMKTFNMDEATTNEVIKKSSKPRKGAVTVGFAMKG